MSTSLQRNQTTVQDIDMKLEVVVIPVSDVDRATDFYGHLGWRHATHPSLTFRVPDSAAGARSRWHGPDAADSRQWRDAASPDRG